MSAARRKKKAANAWLVKGHAKRLRAAVRRQSDSREARATMEALAVAYYRADVEGQKAGWRSYAKQTVEHLAKVIASELALSIVAKLRKGKVPA